MSQGQVMAGHSPFIVRKVAVLGAGVMGAQIAAHLVNANVEVVLFELAAKDGDPNDNVRKAVDGLRKLEPSPLSVAGRTEYIQPANYDQHLHLLRECDIVIEAISERMDWKKALYEKVAPHLGESTIFASNTSGLSINSLSEAMPAQHRSRFCGVHFFNRPRYAGARRRHHEGDAAERPLAQVLRSAGLAQGIARAESARTEVRSRRLPQ